jgi:ATP-dependent Lon protease
VRRILYRLGTIATILQLSELAGRHGEGAGRRRRGARKIEKLHPVSTFSRKWPVKDRRAVRRARRWTCSRAPSASQFEQYVKLNRKVPPESPHCRWPASSSRLGSRTHVGSAHVAQARSPSRRCLEIQDVRKRLEHILALIEGEMDVLQIEKRIRGRVKQQMEKSQREYYLNEQMKAIQKELGKSRTRPNELAELEQRIQKGRHAEGSARQGDERS